MTVNKPAGSNTGNYRLLSQPGLFDQEVKVPLLSGATAADPATITHTVDLGYLFLRRLWALLCLARAAPAFILLVVSVAEAAITSKVGAVASQFYKLFVDDNRDELAHIMLWSAGLYAGSAVFYAFKGWLAEFFAWRWRGHLTRHIQEQYYQQLAFYNLKVGPITA
jgi:MFS family permease